MQKPNATVYVQYKGIFDMQDLYESIANFSGKKFKHETQKDWIPLWIVKFCMFEATRAVRLL